MSRASHDLVIVGGGVMGLSIAFHAAQRGARPLVLERRFPGAGSTGRSGAILRQHYSLELTAAMARDSLIAFREYGERVGADAGFVCSGMVMIVQESDGAGLEANLTLQRSLGIRTETLAPAAIRELLPDAHVPDDVAGCYEPDAGHADPVLVLHALAGAVRRSGGELREGAAVVAVMESGGAVRGVRMTDGTEIGADRVVVAAGPWTASLMDPLNRDVPVRSMRVQSAVFRRPPELRGGPVVIDFVNQMYAKHVAETHVGCIDPSEVEPVDPDAFDEGVDGAYVDLAHERLSRRFPGMERAIRFGGYGALYAVTPDWHPVIGPIGPDGFHVCAGFSGHGFKLAPAVGATVAAELFDTDPPYDFTPLRPQRFQEDRPVTGRYSYSIIG